MSLRSERRASILFVRPLGRMSGSSRYCAIAGTVLSFVDSKRLNFPVAEQSRLACRLINALDHEGPVVRLVFDRLRDFGVESQGFIDGVCVDVRQAASGKAPLCSVSDIEAFVSR